jgi:hypothetical protein
VTDDPTILTAISDATEKSISFGRNQRSTSSDFAVNIVRKPRSTWVGIHKYQSMAEQVMSSDRVKEEFSKVVLDLVYDGFRQRGRLPASLP